MRLADTLARLPAEWKEKLEARPLVRSELEGGRSLAEALGGADWARRWADSAEELDRKVLLRLIRRYAGLPFGEEEAEARLRQEQTEIWTGAEIRVALARLRRDGILFAVRKAWGERLLYVPSDMVGVWQLTLRAPNAGMPDSEWGEEELRHAELPGSGLREESDREATGRLPLSLELLAAWSDIRRRGFPLTAKGVPNKARAAKLSASMGLTAAEVASTHLWPETDHAAVPANVALALDVGLSLGWLSREPGQVAATARAPAGWADLPLAAVDARLLDLATERYAGQEAQLHWAATALRGMKPGEWFSASGALRQWGERMEPDEADREALERWIGLLAACGWVDKRSSTDRLFLRWRIDPSIQAFRSGEMSSEKLGMRDASDEGSVYVQPDLEMIVPPETGFGLRWELEGFAERVALDIVSTYRLTRSSCILASEGGYTFESLTNWLERASGVPLPVPAARALEDWFGRIGKLAFADAKLLRAQNKELADLIAKDVPSSEWLLERLNDCVFAVKPSGVMELAKRMNELGYPPKAPEEPIGAARQSGEKPAEASPAGAASRDDSGWMRLKRLLSVYEPDDSIPERTDLFPGVEAVPAAWLQQPRSYHLSTRRELIERAMAWRTGIRVKREGRVREMIPEALVATENGWKVGGRVRHPEPGEPMRVEWPADSLAELMIQLPDDGAGEPRTNR